MDNGCHFSPEAMRYLRLHLSQRHYLQGCCRIGEIASCAIFLSKSTTSSMFLEAGASGRGNKAKGGYAIFLPSQKSTGQTNFTSGYFKCRIVMSGRSLITHSTNHDPSVGGEPISHGYEQMLEILMSFRTLIEYGRESPIGMNRFRAGALATGL